MQNEELIGRLEKIDDELKDIIENLDFYERQHIWVNLGSADTSIRESIIYLKGKRYG